MLHYNYLLFDAARAEMNLYTAQELNPNNQSLYRGSAVEDLAGIAPYLFTIKPNTPFADWYFKEGWNNSWGTLLSTNASFDDIYKHFRKFLMVKTEDGEQLYFRFYDPRVLRIFLPTCDRQQLVEIFGPVIKFFCEDEDPDFVLVFYHDNTKLITERVRASEMAPELAATTEQQIISVEDGKTGTEPPDPEKENKTPPKQNPDERKPRFRFYSE